MKNIGFTGGSSVCELGSASDIQLFFDCIEIYAVQKNPQLNWQLLTDRLRMRYLRINELDDAIVLMSRVKDIFSNLPSNAINWQGKDADSTKTHLDPKKEKLVDIFKNYFEDFFHCAESAKLNYEGFKSYPNYEYEPVRIVRTEIPWLALEKKRPLEDYDALNGKPFWQL